jgi:hypothetical protein
MLSLLPSPGFFGGEERLWFFGFEFSWPTRVMNTYLLLLPPVAPFFSFTSLYGFRPGHS